MSSGAADVSWSITAASVPRPTLTCVATAPDVPAVAHAMPRSVVCADLKRWPCWVTAGHGWRSPVRDRENPWGCGGAALSCSGEGPCDLVELRVADDRGGFAQELSTPRSLHHPLVASMTMACPISAVGIRHFVRAVALASGGTPWGPAVKCLPPRKRPDVNRWFSARR